MLALEPAAFGCFGSTYAKTSKCQMDPSVHPTIRPTIHPSMHVHACIHTLHTCLHACMHIYIYIYIYIDKQIGMSKYVTCLRCALQMESRAWKLGQTYTQYNAAVSARLFVLNPKPFVLNSQLLCRQDHFRLLASWTTTFREKLPANICLCACDCSKRSRASLPPEWGNFTKAKASLRIGRFRLFAYCGSSPLSARVVGPPNIKKVFQQPAFVLIRQSPQRASTKSSVAASRLYC